MCFLFFFFIGKLLVCDEVCFGSFNNFYVFFIGGYIKFFCGIGCSESFGGSGWSSWLFFIVSDRSGSLNSILGLVISVESR